MKNSSSLAFQCVHGIAPKLADLRRVADMPDQCDLSYGYMCNSCMQLFSTVDHRAPKIIACKNLVVVTKHLLRYAQNKCGNVCDYDRYIHI